MRKLKLFLTLLMLMCIGITQMWGAEETITYVFGDRDWAATVGETEANWTCNTRAAGFTANQGTQITTSADGANATSPESFDNISKIVVNYCTNSKKGAGAIKVKVGEGTEKSYTVTAPSANGTTRRNADDFTFSPAESGKVTLTVNCTANSIYIYSVTITYTPDSGDDPGDDPGTQKTDVTDEQLAWSEESAEVTMGADNTFPTLTNTLPLDVTYQSTVEAVATIDANGDVTLVKAGTTTIKAIFDGDDNYNAKTVSYTLTVNPAPLQPIEGAVVDVLTAANFTATQTQYTNFSGKQATNDGHSEAVYAGNTAKNSTNIQMTKKDSNKSPQIASTTSGGNVKRVEVIYGGSNTDSRKIAIYGRNTAYDGSTYNASTDTKLGEITYSTGDVSGYIDIEGNYQYLVIISVDGAMYFSEVRISWLPSAKHEFTFGVAESGHGTLAASVGGAAINSGAQVAEGATVTLTPTADTYYQVSAVTVLDGEAAEVTTTKNAGVYTFTMPTSNTEAEVSFAYIPVTGLTLNKSELELLVDAEETLSVTAVEPDNAYAGVNWSSSAASVATVDETGKVTAKAAGTATITATSIATGTVTATCAVTVTAPSGHEIGITSANGTVVATSGDDVIDAADVLKDVAIVLTATPNDGYTISGWTVVGLDEGDYSISQDKTTCSFTMPDNEVLIEVAYTHEVAVLKLHDAAGVTEFAGNHFWKEEVTLPTSAAPCSKTFIGWSANAECATAPELGATYVLPNIGDNDIYAVYASVVSAGVTSYVKTAMADIASGSEVVVTEKKEESLYAMANDGGTSNPPAAVAVTDEEGVLTGGVVAKVLWTLTKDGDNFSLAKGDDKLYCTNTNNGVRVGSNENKVFAIKDNYLFNNATSRYVGVYNSQDFRCYTSINSNITGQTLAFYKKTVSDPVYGNYSTTCQSQVAAPTGLTAGTYYAAQTITLAATNGAAIYYSLDGNDPTVDAQHLYSEPFTLSERAVVTVKAIAVKEGYENSEVAEAQYNINLPYSVAEFNELTLENNKEYAVRGMISQIVEVQNGKLIYYISANGSTEGQIKCHKGLKVNKETFNSADEVNLGDNVTVVGTWLTQYTNLGENNWMLEYTARAHDSYEIVGDLATTGFQVGEAFDDAILANLSVKEVFTNGYEEAVAGATFNCGDKTEWLENETTLTVYAKLGDDDLTSKNFGVTVSSATLVSFVLKEGYKTEYYVGDAFVKPTVIATLSDNTHPEAEATACTGYNMSEAGNYTVNVSYTYGDITISEGVEYQITVKKVFDNEDAPHTVAVADALITNNGSSSASADYMWVRGIVSQVGSINKNNQLTYYISDNGSTTGQLKVYNGKYLDNASFTNDNKLQVNDEVVIKGKIQIYNDENELVSSQVISLARGVEVTVADVAELEVGQADLAVEDLTITTLSEGAVTLVSGDEAIATIVDNKIHAVAAGEVTITANVAANGIYKAASDEFTVHVVATKPRYTVTFSTGDAGENVSGDAPEAIDNQLENAEVTLPACTWTWEGHKFTGWAVTYGENVPVEVENNQFNMPAGNVTLTAQWAEVATCRISFQVNGEEVAHANAPQDADYNISQVGTAVDGFTFLGWSETAYADEVETLPTMISVYHASLNEENKVLYGIYKREQVEDHGHYVLNYTANVADKTLGYGNAVAVTAKDGSEWIVKAYKSNGMQINTSKDASIKIPNCPGKIFSIAITTSTTKSVGLSASDYSGTGTITYIKYGTDAASQTLDLSGETVTAGYIVPKGGNAIITNIDVEFDASKTYYTSSPVEKVTITFDANGGEGGCQKAIINKGAQLTICDEAPVKSHSDFAGWKNGDDEYVAGQAYTFDADITLTAQWDPASTYTVTYDVNGSTADAPTEDAQYAGDQFTVAAAIAREEYTFQGWKYGSKLYKAGASFTMPAEAVTFVAQWRKASVPVDRMSLVTDASALANGMQIALGYSAGETFAMAGDLGSNTYMASITDGVSLSDGVATYTEDVVVMTLEQVGNGWKITKDGTHYLNETSVKSLAWTTKEHATTWSISFSGNNVKIANGDNWIQYNSSNPRFTTYASGQKDIQLFGKAVVVTEDASISDLGYVEGENIIADGNITLTIDEQTNAQSITAKNGATVVIEKQTTAENVVVEDGSKIVANAETTTPTVYFSTSMGSTQTPGSASELGSVTNITLATGGEIIYDLTLGTSMEGIQADPNQWHAFTLPFAVDALNGIYDAVTGEKLENEVNYAIMDYHGDIRANGQYGWKKYRGILQPGVFYIMTVDGNTKTFRFKAAKTGAMTQTTSMSVTAFNGLSENDNDKGWNGIGNPAWVSGKVAKDVYVLDPYSYEYVLRNANNFNFTVSTPFFYFDGAKTGATSVISMETANASSNYAPRRTPANEIKNVEVSFGTEVYKDLFYISASEDALNEFEQDQDQYKLRMSKTPKVAQIMGNAYGKQMAKVYAPMSNDKAEYSLTLYAPNAGEYTISAPAMEDADIYLTKDGAIIWNLTMSEYTNDFTKGNNEGYGLMLIKKAPGAATGTENIEAAEAGAQKVVINNNVYILRNEQMYDVTGKAVK